MHSPFLVYPFNILPACQACHLATSLSNFPSCQENIAGESLDLLFVSENLCQSIHITTNWKSTMLVWKGILCRCGCDWLCGINLYPRVHDATPVEHSILSRLSRSLLCSGRHYIYLTMRKMTVSPHGKPVAYCYIHHCLTNAAGANLIRSAANSICQSCGDRLWEISNRDVQR